MPFSDASAHITGAHGDPEPADPEHQQSAHAYGDRTLPIIRSEIRIIRDMGDAGEGLVDAESRLAERMDEREEERRKTRTTGKAGDPERVSQLESCRLARTEMQRQLELTSHRARKQQLTEAIAELDRRITQLSK